MMTTSRFYFDAMAYGKDVFRDLPMFAIHAGQSTSEGWDSATATDVGRFRMVMQIVNPQVPVFLAMPRPVQAAYFPKDRTYSKLTVSAYRQIASSLSLGNGGYLQGFSFALVLKDVKVMEVRQIMQWGNLPNPPDVQKNYLERKMGREAYFPVAVRLFASNGNIV
jgi:hypothetical protein